ncbi:MAG: T9SS type A sorting domain-containing protein [Bacteroidales bacterium]|nr:T9SS type A sorting domain-containing protein [Bacteroidales bacterium]
MKKLLSICFLSILLGLMSFSVQAQNNSCTSGFWIENLQPEELTGIVNLPEGSLDLSHTLGTSWYDQCGMVLGNAHPGVSELYELHFCNNCGLDPKTRVSLDWLLYKDGQLVNGNLSDYADLEIYTEYVRLNQQGQCQSIHWLGGKVNDASGFCTQQEAPDMFSGYPSPDRMNYPGAMQVQYSYPDAVFTNGNIHPAGGYVNVYSEKLNYFNLDFFDQARTIARITWKQVGNYSLVMRVRQMYGGTEYNNLYWNENETQDFVGGHQAVCGPVIAQDSIHGLVMKDMIVQVCEDANATQPFTLGDPEYVFENGDPNPQTGSMPDTNVVWITPQGDVTFNNGECAYIDVDSVVKLHFYIRENPDLDSVEHEVCRCDFFTADSLVALLDTVDNNIYEGFQYGTFLWNKFANPTTAQLNNPANWTTEIPEPYGLVAGTYTYYVRQISTYWVYDCYGNKSDTLDCMGDIATVTLTVKPIPTPVVEPTTLDFCNEQTYSNPKVTAKFVNNNGCGERIKWFVKDGNNWKPAEVDTNTVAANWTLTINLNHYRPTTNVDKTVQFRAFGYNVVDTNGVELPACDSSASEIVKVNFHRTPETQLTYDKIVCPMPESELDFTVRVLNTKNNNQYPGYRNLAVAHTYNVDYKFNGVTKRDSIFNVNTDKVVITDEFDLTCGEEYKVYFVTTDKFGCYKRDTATFVAKDSINPVVSPAAITTYVDACAVDSNSYPKYDFTNVTSAADFKLKNVYNMPSITDNCAINWKKTTQSDVVVSVSDTTCEAITIRTYTFYDYCDSTATLTQTIIARDSVRPYFDFSTTLNGMPYVKINPIPAGDCKYDAPDSMVFVNAVRDFVKDNCTDPDYLISTIKFFWEHTDLSPIGEKDIFRVHNHLTVDAHISDRCGNDTTMMVIYIDRPDTLSIAGRPVALDPICQDATTTITFDTNLIKDDTIVGPFLPYTYQWKEVNGREVVFGTPNAYETTVAPVGYGDFVFVITVTNSNGCTADSKPFTLHVNPTPNVAIYRDVRNGETEPYCPTYGNVRLYAADATTGAKLSGLTFTWSGESVNTAPTTDSSWVTIVPELCKHDYPVTLVATDAIGCFATAYDTIKVEDTEGLVYLGSTIDSVVTIENECKMYVPDFKPFFNNISIESKCWPWSKIVENTNWYSQSPEAGTEMTENTDVVITLTAPCNDKKTTYTFKALVPEDRLRAKITVVGDSVCENEPNFPGVELTATPVNGEPSYTYKWYRNDVVVSGVLGASDVYTAYDTAEYNQNTIINYKVEITDALGCVATANKDITIFYKGTLPDTTTYPNTLCVGQNGSLVLFGVIRNYTYIFQEQVKVHDVPEHQVTPSNTMVFDHCYAGEDMPLVVITPDGCEQTMYIDIANQNDDKPAKPVAEGIAPTDCFQADGKINVTTLVGNIQYYYKKNDSAAMALVNPITGAKPTDIYKIWAVNTITGCVSDTLETSVPRFESGFAVNATASDNTSCADVKNGKISLADAANYYVVTTAVAGSTSVDTIYQGNGNHVVDSLAKGNYTVYEKNPETNCDAVKVFEIKDVLTMPYVNVTPKHNNYCDPAKANGGFTYTVKKNTSSGQTMPAADYTYVIKVGNDSIVPAGKYDSLYEGTYTFVATSTVGCVGSKNFTVNKNTATPRVALAQTMNNFCDTTKWDGTLKVTVTNPTSNPMGSKFNYILSHKGVNIDTAVSMSSPYTFQKLDGVEYSVTVVTEYGCSASAQKTVEQYEVPALVMTSTPNTMCESTFEKPGNGTVSITAPVGNGSTHIYHYNYYFAENPEMNVPYHDPLTMTKYWLKDDLYLVEAHDIVTGCRATDTMRVDFLGRSAELEFVTTENTNCEGAYNGSVTVDDVVFTPEYLDGKFLYSIDSVTFVSNPTFTGLKDSSYTIYAKDTTTNCLYQGKAVIENGNECAPQVVIYDTKGDTADVFHYCVGEEIDLFAGASAAPGCEEGLYEYNWYVSCHERTANVNKINVLTDEAPFCCHYTVTVKSLATGCTQTKDVLVCVEKTPDVIFAINDVPVGGNTATICENEEFKIGVVKENTVNGYTTRLKNCTWSNSFKSTSFDTIFDPYSLIPDTTYSLCVDVVSEYGCTNRGVFSLTVNSVPVVTVYDTVCTTFDFPRGGYYKIGVTINDVYQEVDPSTVSLPTNFVISDQNTPEHFVMEGQDVNNPKFIYHGSNGCDSIVIHDVTMLGFPKIEVAHNDTIVCDGTSYADLLTAAGVTIVNAQDTVLTLNNVEVALTDVVEYTSNDPQSLVITCKSGPEGCTVDCPSERELTFYVGGKPSINAAAFTANAYCAGSEGNFNIDIEYNYANSNADDLEVLLVFRDSTDVANVTETVVKTWDNLPPVGTSGTTFTMHKKYGIEKGYFFLMVANACDTAWSNPVQVAVDSAVLNITDKVFCEGEEITVNSVKALFSANTDNIDFSNAKVIFIKDGNRSEMTPTFTMPITNSGAKMTVIGLQYDGPCPEVKCDTVTIRVDSLPSADITPLTQPICLDEAKEAFQNAVTNIKNATSYGYKISGVNRQSIAQSFDNFVNVPGEDTVSVANVDELVKKAFGFFKSEVFFYVSNDCKTITYSLGKTSIIDVPKVTADAEVTICNNWTVDSVVNATNATIDWNNIVTTFGNDTMYNSLVHYSIVRDNAVVKELSVTNPINGLHANGAAVKHTILTTQGAQDGDSLRIVAHTYNTVSCAGGDTLYIKLNIQTLDFVEDTLQTACAGEPFSSFIKDMPQFTGKATLVAGAEKWYVAADNQMIDAKVITADSIITEDYNGNYVMYVWRTECGDSVSTTPKQLTVNTVPVTPTLVDTTTTCEGQTLDLTTISFVVESETEVTDTTWRLGADVIDIENYAFAKIDSGKVLYVEITNECGTGIDSIALKVNPRPVPAVTGDTIVCEGQDVTLNVVDPVTTSTYAWYDNTDASVGSGATLTLTPNEGINEYYVVETDENGCVSVNNPTVTVKSTDNPQFIFTYNGAETHNIEGITTSTDQLLNYTWKIDQMCMSPDSLVYVEFRIYHEDTLINNARISDYFVYQTYSDPQGGGTTNWISSDQMTWNNVNGTPVLPFTSYFNASSPLSLTNPGNHFPSANLVDEGNTYTALYLHFLNNREITKTFAPIRIPGNYKVVYQLWSTNHKEDIQYKYTNDELGVQLIGAQNAMSPTTQGRPTLFTLLATDSITINVEGEVINNANAPDATVPEVAPEIVVPDSDVQVSMEIWPNPATTVTTKISARVHNLSGNATVTISDVATGRQFFFDNTFINSDDFVYECAVNNLTEGFYVITVRTAEGVVTKKLVVRR